MENKLKLYVDLAKYFKTKGFALFLVGGTVRDILLHHELDDMDLVTDATPEEMKTILSEYKVDYTFAKFGSIKLIYEDVKFDITTLRKENAYKDSRHPGNIEFVKELSIDVKRRDFTVNAMYMDMNFKLIDYVNGEDDLNKGVLRMLGNPDKRIAEDPLRIIRAIRFCLTYNLVLDKELESSIIKNIKLIEKLNIKKVEQDIKKIKCDDKTKLVEMFTKFNIQHLLDVID